MDPINKPIVKRRFFKPYQYTVTITNKIYHIKLLPVSKQHIVTINSKYIWQIKRGVVKGARFKTKHSRLLDLRSLLQHENPIVVFQSYPYKLLQYINESDLVPLQHPDTIHGIPVFYSLDTAIQQISLM